MDSQLTKMIHKFRTGGYDAFPTSAVGKVESEKLGLVAHFFARRVHGVKFSAVFAGLDCLDASLEHGRGIGFGFAQRFTPAEAEQIAASFQTGRKCEQKLDTTLHHVRGVPRGVIATMARIDRQLAKVIHKLKARRYFYFPSSQIGRIQNEKLALIGHFFAQPVYGVPLSDVFDRLDCLDRQLGYGSGIARAYGHTFTSGADNLIANSFKTGMVCKQALEDELHNSH
jgi:hypothetical protein